MSYTIWRVLLLFITALFITSPTSLNTLFITCQTHVLYAVSSPISIHYCSVHYLSKRESYTRPSVLFLFITALLITCRQTYVLYAAANPISIHYCSIHYL